VFLTSCAAHCSTRLSPHSMLRFVDGDAECANKCRRSCQDAESNHPQSNPQHWAKAGCDATCQTDRCSGQASQDAEYTEQKSALSEAHRSASSDGPLVVMNYGFRRYIPVHGSTIIYFRNQRTSVQCDS
jgi:hypothetical protein